MRRGGFGTGRRAQLECCSIVLGFFVLASSAQPPPPNSHPPPGAAPPPPQSPPAIGATSPPPAKASPPPALSSSPPPQSTIPAPPPPLDVLPSSDVLCFVQAQTDTAVLSAEFACTRDTVLAGTNPTACPASCLRFLNMIPEKCRHSLATEGATGSYFAQYFDFCAVPYSSTSNAASVRYASKVLRAGVLLAMSAAMVLLFDAGEQWRLWL